MTNTVVALASETRVAQLVELAIHGLEAMYDQEKGLFCHRLKQTPSGNAQEGISERYTVMTLLGLLRAEGAGCRSPVDIYTTIDALYRDTGWVDNIGDLGLLLWLSSVSSRKLDTFYATFNLENALRNYSDSRKRLTMELAWFLTGLTYASQTKQKRPPYIEPLARQTYTLLKSNQGKDSLFGHMAKWKSLAGAIRGHVGSFADQVYPIFAMAHFGQVFGLKEALQNSLQGANTICRLQGPLGQWWWHYDSTTGRVVGRYPVYSVHQHAMAPMALFAAQDACNTDFREPIYKGLEWIGGANELQQSLEDKSASLVWRCIRPTKSTSSLGRLSALVGQERTGGTLHILHECRPYELGWLLYAFAGRESKATEPTSSFR
ncbi:MAG TPA: hypothetical protein VN950_15900 [Terriglobales bacterium]|nr:hypothetical protein [Terriglobales bacterium]